MQRSGIGEGCISAAAEDAERLRRSFEKKIKSLQQELDHMKKESITHSRKEKEAEARVCELTHNNQKLRTQILSLKPHTHTHAHTHTSEWKSSKVCSNIKIVSR
eukprot:GHVR01156356.1.p1 GENE.GHVR01156356.1~~GHVR01156356.1.p1  ORF type:complete len:104 (-),score=43.48 GHVR01156356.1:98-409(-)